MFVAVGHEGVRIVSDVGKTWGEPELGKEGEVYRAVAFGNGHFAAVGSYGGSNIMAGSTDGRVWKTASEDARYAHYFRGLGFGAGKFLALGGDPGAVGISKPFVATSKNGVKWSGHVEVGGKHMLRRFAYGNELFVAVGDRGRRARSSDGLKWEDAPDVRALDTLIDVAFGNGVFVGVGLHGLRMSTSDGLAWSEPQRGLEGEHLNTIVWADGRFVAVGQGATFFSEDGEKWERRENHRAPLTMCHGDGVFVGSHWKGRLLRSEDAVQWVEVYKGEHHIEAVTHGAV